MIRKTIPLLWISGLLLVLASCSRQQYPAENSYPHNRHPGHLPPGQAKKIYGGRAPDYAPGHYRTRPYGYRPPVVVVIADRDARCDNRGQWYYHNEYGYRYWKQQDGRYHLDQQYSRDHFKDRDDNNNRGRNNGRKNNHRRGGRG